MILLKNKIHQIRFQEKNYQSVLIEEKYKMDSDAVTN